MGRVQLILYDFIISFMWVWSGCLVKMFVSQGLGIGHQPKAEIVKGALSVANMFFFAFLAKVTKGGAYNPLTVLSSAVSGDFSHFLFTVGVRIPVQVIGSITGVRLIIQTFPGIGLGPRLNVDIHQGDGMGLCSWRSYHEGAYTCILACSNRGNFVGRLDFSVGS
ncbi:hypothetical protein DITRI_Ditri09bG0160300 [Diplodiscus trichospermus]